MAFLPGGARGTPATGSSVFVHEYAARVRSADGRWWRAQAWASNEPTGGWSGWLTFLPVRRRPRGAAAPATDRGGGPAWTEAETKQSLWKGVHYWAMGLEPAYLEGALARALERPELIRRTDARRDAALLARAASYERLSRALGAEARALRRLAGRPARSPQTERKTIR